MGVGLSETGTFSDIKVERASGNLSASNWYMMRDIMARRVSGNFSRQLTQQRSFNLSKSSVYTDVESDKNSLLHSQCITLKAGSLSTII